jgi:hypothetical protein
MAVRPPLLHFAEPFLKPFQRRRFQARSHDADAVADPGADLAIEAAIGHRPDCLGEALGYLIKSAQGA